MGSLAVIETIASLPSGTCAVGATMDMNQGDQGRVYVASNTQSGVVNVVDVGTSMKSWSPFQSVYVRWESGYGHGLSKRSRAAGDVAAAPPSLVVPRR